MNLELAIKQAIKDFGTNILIEPRLVNILNDYGIFREDKASMFVISELIKAHILTNLCADIKNNFAESGEKKGIVDLYVNKVLSLYPFRDDAVRSILSLVANLYVLPDETSQYLVISKDKMCITSCKKNASGEIATPHYIYIIKDEAFINCTKLTKIVLRRGVISIGTRAFKNCQTLESIIIPQSTKVIGSCILEKAKVLNSIYLQITNPFNICLYCDSFSSINQDKCTLYVPEGSEQLYRLHPSFSFFKNITEFRMENAFNDCNSSPKENTNSYSHQSENMLRILHSKVFECNKKASGEIFVPNDTDEIYSCAFSDCIGLKKIVLPDSIRELSYNAFSGCISLENINLPENIKAIGYGCFQNCHNLKSVSLPPKLEKIGGNAFDGCYLLKNIFLPASVKEIGGAISCGYIVVDPNNQNFISESGILYSKDKTVIYQYPSLDIDCEYSMPNSVKRIADGCFRDSLHLHDIRLSDKLEEIDNHVFWGCDNLRSLTIPASIRKIASCCFTCCAKLESIRMNSITPQEIDIKFDWYLSNFSNINLYVPQRALDLYKKHNVFNKFKQIIGY